MKIRSALILGVALLFGTTVPAQDDHKIEVTGNYSYIHANPQNNQVVPTFSLNGGGGSGAFHFSKYIGIVVDTGEVLSSPEIELVSANNHR